MRVVTDLDDAFVHSQLTIDLELAGTLQGSVDLSLKDASGKQIYSKEVDVKETLRIETHIENPHKWTNETPYLYARFDETQAAGRR